MALYLFFLFSKVGNKVPILTYSFVFIRNKFILYWITDFIHDSYVFLNLDFIHDFIMNKVAKEIFFLIFFLSHYFILSLLEKYCLSITKECEKMVIVVGKINKK